MYNYGNPNYAVHFYSSLIGVVVGNTTILRTVNGGDTWTPLALNQFAAIGASFKGGVGITVGNAGKIFRSSNDGQTWALIASGTTENLRGVQGTSTGSSFVAYSESGRMLYSADGSTWTPMRSVVDGRLTAIRYYDDSLGLAVGYDGIILRTTTGGQ